MNDNTLCTIYFEKVLHFLCLYGVHVNPIYTIGHFSNIIHFLYSFQFLVKWRVIVDESSVRITQLSTT